MDSGVQRESGRGVRFGSRRPGPGREKQSQTRDCAPGGAAEPQSHPGKHPLRVRLVGGMWPGQALQMQPLSDWLDAHQLQPGRQDAKGDQSVKNAGSDRFRLDRLQPAAMRARLLGPTVRLRAWRMQLTSQPIKLLDEPGRVERNTTNQHIPAPC